jgi:hypothetical protein
MGFLHHNLAMFSYDGQLYSTGGQPHGKAVYSLDPGLPHVGWRNSSLAMHPRYVHTNTPLTLLHPSSPRYSHGCTVIPAQSGPNLLLAGGLAPDTGKCAHTELVSLNQEGQTAGEVQAVCHSAAGLVEVGGRVFMVGGKRLV